MNYRLVDRLGNSHGVFATTDEAISEAFALGIYTWNLETTDDSVNNGEESDESQ